MLISEMPELDRMTAGEAVSMPACARACDRGAMRGCRMIAGERRALRHVLFQAALAAACHNLALKPVPGASRKRASRKLVIIAIARPLITIANAVLKSSTTWQHQTRAQTQLLEPRL